MLNKQKIGNLSFKILKIVFFSPILISIPFFTSINESKAGLEFQWDQDSGLRKLKWFQKEDRVRFRNTIYFFLRTRDRQSNIINLTLPKTYIKV